jgi:hypothetical protein
MSWGGDAPAISSAVTNSQRPCAGQQQMDLGETETLGSAAVKQHSRLCKAHACCLCMLLVCSRHGSYWWVSWAVIWCHVVCFGTEVVHLQLRHLLGVLRHVTLWQCDYTCLSSPAVAAHTACQQLLGDPFFCNVCALACRISVLTGLLHCLRRCCKPYSELSRSTAELNHVRC